MLDLPEDIDDLSEHLNEIKTNKEECFEYVKKFLEDSVLSESPEDIIDIMARFKESVNDAFLPFEHEIDYAISRAAAQEMIEERAEYHARVL